jgi:hypothetical protein
MSAVRTGWLYPADTVRGRADRMHVQLRQRCLGEFVDGTNNDPLVEKRQRLDEDLADAPPSAAAPEGSDE